MTTYNRVTTWIPGDVLTASALNTEFNAVQSSVNNIDSDNLATLETVSFLNTTATSTVSINNNDQGTAFEILNQFNIDGDGIIQNAMAMGGVTVRQADRIASGAQAHFANGRLVLTGEPTVRQSGHQMAGKEIVFIVGQDTIECKQCTMTVKPVMNP